MVRYPETDLLPPNMRVQRTRSSASPPRSPLTHRPLGGMKRRRLRAVLLRVGLDVGTKRWQTLILT
jgi:hypothetical protein